MLRVLLAVLLVCVATCQGDFTRDNHLEDHLGNHLKDHQENHLDDIQENHFDKRSFASFKFRPMGEFENCFKEHHFMIVMNPFQRRMKQS